MMFLMTFFSGARARFALVAAMATLESLAVLPAQAASTPQVSGVVTGADGSDPIAGIKVCAEIPNGDDQCTTSGADGSYFIKLKVAPVRYHAYQEYLYGDWVEQTYKNGQIFHIKSTTVHHVNFALQRGATISGHLYGPDGGNPNDTYLNVEAYTVDANGTTHGYANLLSNTNDDGYFQISKMPAGTYMLLVKDNDTPQNYGQQWYPDASMASAGTPITVTTGEHVTGKDMTLSTPGSLSIQTLYGTHSAQGQIEVRDADGREIDFKNTDSHGRVTFPVLRPGNYKIRTLAWGAWDYSEWYSHKRSAATANTIAVTSGETTSQQMTLHYVTLTANSRPRLHVHGNELELANTTWNVRPNPIYSEYSWYRDGKRLSGHPFNWYITKKADVGHHIKACVIANRSGYAPGRTCSRYSPKITVY